MALPSTANGKSDRSIAVGDTFQRGWAAVLRVDVGAAAVEEHVRVFLDQSVCEATRSSDADDNTAGRSRIWHGRVVPRHDAEHGQHTIEALQHFRIELAVVVADGHLDALGLAVAIG